MSHTPDIHITGADSHRYLIGGRSFTGAQVCDALSVAFDLAVSYAMAERENGGHEHIKWEWIDETAAKADIVMADHMQSWVIPQAREYNGFEESVEDSTCPWCGAKGPNFDESEQPSDYCHHEMTAEQTAAFNSSALRNITLPDGTVRHNVGSDNLSDEDRAAANADMNAWLAERKKADDTEGGACD